MYCLPGYESMKVWTFHSVFMTVRVYPGFRVDMDPETREEMENWKSNRSIIYDAWKQNGNGTCMDTHLRSTM